MDVVPGSRRDELDVSKPASSREGSVRDDSSISSSRKRALRSTEPDRWPNPRKYNKRSLLLFRLESPFRKALIAAIEWPWWDRIVLFVILINSCMLAYNQPYDIPELRPNDTERNALALVSQVNPILSDLTHTHIHTSFIDNSSGVQIIKTNHFCTDFLWIFYSRMLSEDYGSWILLGKGNVSFGFMELFGFIYRAHWSARFLSIRWKYGKFKCAALFACVETLARNNEVSTAEVPGRLAAEVFAHAGECDWLTNVYILHFRNSWCSTIRWAAQRRLLQHRQWCKRSNCIWRTMLSLPRWREPL